MRIGHGYDLHRLVAGRPLILGGVTIPFERGLLGHSDADVLTHAVIDALLGAAGERDIGAQFSDSDPAYKDADSLALLGRVMVMLSGHGFAVGNIDCTVVTEQPKLGPHIAQMREALARAMGVDLAAVNVKATTEEGLGATGAGEAIACHCAALLLRE